MIQLSNLTPIYLSIKMPTQMLVYKYSIYPFFLRAERWRRLNVHQLVNIGCDHLYYIASLNNKKEQNLKT